MTGEPIDTPELDESASFAELLEAHAGGTRNVRPGDRISAAIVAITDDSVFVATGSKVDGVIDRRELEEADGSLPYAVGDRVDLYVTAVNGQEIRLSKGLSGQMVSTAMMCLQLHAERPSSRKSRRVKVKRKQRISSRGLTPTGVADGSAPLGLSAA